jgi:GT2 family glycosyltransferase
MLDYMDSHPEVAACQPKLLCQWSPKDFEYAGACGGYIDALGYPYCRGRVMGTVEEDKGQYDEPASLLWATGAALMIRREAYWQAGGLDGRFFAHQEEIDLCWRLRSRGYGIACVPQSKVWHVGGGTLPKDSPHKTYLNFRNNLLLLYKNLPSERLETVMRVRFWLDALASVQFLLTGKWGSFLAVWRGRRDFFCMRPQFVADRERNLKAAVLSPVPEQTAVSILWQYYARGKKTFKEIHPTENNNKQHI